MADPLIQESKFKRKVTLSAANTSAVGSLLYHDGTNYALADASDGSKEAQLVALQIGTAEEIEAAPYVVLADTDAPYTQDATQYLSETAGAITETRPTTAGSLRQVIGRAHSTSLIEIDLKTSEVQVPLSYMTSSGGVLTLDSGHFVGIGHLDAQNETANYTCVVPENALAAGAVKAGFYTANEGGTGTQATVTVGSAIDGAQHDAVTADSVTTLAIAGGAADEVQEADFIAALNGTNIVRPGALLAIDVLQSDSATNDCLLFGGYITFKVAG